MAGDAGAGRIPRWVSYHSASAPGFSDRKKKPPMPRTCAIINFLWFVFALALVRIVFFWPATHIAGVAPANDLDLGHVLETDGIKRVLDSGDHAARGSGAIRVQPWLIGGQAKPAWNQSIELGSKKAGLVALKLDDIQRKDAVECLWPVGEDVDSPFYQLDSVCDALSAQSIAGLPDHHAGMIKPDYPARRHNRGTS